MNKKLAKSPAFLVERITRHTCLCDQFGCRVPFLIEKGGEYFFFFSYSPHARFLFFWSWLQLWFLPLALSERRRSVRRMLNPLFMSFLQRMPSEKWIASRMECEFFGEVLGTIEGKKSSVLLLRNKTALSNLIRMSFKLRKMPK